MVALAVVQQVLIDQLLVETLGYVFVTHAVSSHLQMIEVLFDVEDVGRHALVIDQVDLQSVIGLILSQHFLLDLAEDCVVLFLRGIVVGTFAIKILNTVGIQNAAPVVI